MSIHNPTQVIKDPQIALDFLKEGNDRFVQNKLTPKDIYTSDREQLDNGQVPFAVIICCSDSRVAPEIFFDQMLGDIFVIRNAGNIVDTTVLGSLEYAVDHLGSPLVVVCGHSKCGAVTAACAGEELPPNIRSITEQIAPAVKMGGDVDQVIRNNVSLMVKRIEADSIVTEFGVKVVGAYYDIHTGEIFWL